MLIKVWLNKRNEIFSKFYQIFVKLALNNDKEGMYFTSQRNAGWIWPVFQYIICQAESIYSFFNNSWWNSELNRILPRF